MLRLPSTSLLGALLLLSGSPGMAEDPADPDAAPPRRREIIPVIGLPEQPWHVELDTKAIAQDSLKGQWGNLSEEQQRQFTGLLAQVFNVSYRRLQQTVGRQEITMTGEERRPDGLFVRRFSCRPRDPSDLAMDFSIIFARDEQGLCLIKDWVQDGVSTVNVYRVQFLKILRTEGFPVLLEKMRAKIKRDTDALKPPAS